MPVGTVTEVDTGPGLTGGPITQQGTVSLLTPVAIAIGGTGGTTAATGLANLGGAPLASPNLSGIPTAPNASVPTNTTQIATTAYVESRVAAATAGVSSVAAGNGLVGGGTGAVTVGLAAPVNLANGGTSATSAPAALANLGGAPLASPTFTGALTSPGNFHLSAPNSAYYFYDSGGAERGRVDNTGFLWLNDLQVTTANVSYVQLYDASGNNALLLGGSSGPTNIYRNTNHTFQGIGGAGTLLTMTPTSAAFTQALSSNAGITAGGGVYPSTNNAQYCGAAGNAWFACTAYAFTNASDVKYKTDLADLPECLPLVAALAPRRYKITNGPDEDRAVTHWGFVAQDVEQAIGSGADFGGHHTDKDTGEQGIRYHELTACLWQAVRELTARLESLEGKAT
jgi:hypothetical protein